MGYSVTDRGLARTVAAWLYRFMSKNNPEARNRVERAVDFLGDHYVFSTVLLVGGLALGSRGGSNPNVLLKFVEAVAGSTAATAGFVGVEMAAVDLLEKLEG
jgi:hypothetical protein